MAEEGLAEFLEGVRSGEILPPAEDAPPSVEEDTPSAGDAGDSLEDFLQDAKEAGAPPDWLTKLDDGRTPEQTNALLIDKRNEAANAWISEFVDPAAGYGVGALVDRSVRPKVVNALGGQKNATAFRDVLTDASKRTLGGPGAALTRFSTSSMAPRLGGSLLFSQTNPITAAVTALYPELSWQLKQHGLMPDFIGAEGNPELAHHWRTKLADEGTPYIPLPGHRGEPGVEAVVSDAFGRQLPNALDQVGLKPVHTYFAETLPWALSSVGSGDWDGDGKQDAYAPDITGGALFNDPLSVPGNVWDAMPNDWDDWSRVPGLFGF